MKDFTYYNNKRSLHAYACSWLRKMGLRETRWILDREWFFIHCNTVEQLTFKRWIGE